ncbi:MAG: archaeal heat shock protein Hsp20 [Chloroflexota bacterium]
MEQGRIKELRVRLDLSQERFARHLGVSLQTVRRWESGLTKPIPIIKLKLEELLREVGENRQGEGGTPMRREKKQSAGGGDLGLGGVFKSMGSLLDLAAKMTEEGHEEATQSGEFEAMGGKLKGVYGFSIRIGLGGTPVIEQFGNIQETETGPVITETREPLVDVMDEGGRLVVIVELPGIEEQNIQLKVEGDMLDISASTRDRSYQKEVLLPWAVDPKTLESSYRNGVLEIRMAKE